MTCPSPMLIMGGNPRGLFGASVRVRGIPDGTKVSFAEDG